MIIYISKDTTIGETREKLAVELGIEAGMLRIDGIKGFCEAAREIHEAGYIEVEHSELGGLDGSSGFEMLDDIPITRDLDNETVFKYALISGHQRGLLLDPEVGGCNAAHIAALTILTGSSEEEVGVEFTEDGKEEQCEASIYYEANSLPFT
ncbi:hypothetical protein GGI15_001474 [Coemansia interrupta]|uniref:Uncharacterized protein n=1 Tax=Coemansia interrupta TaxID=1126814 RepID=A0A9W8HJJ9_9FUNG|nr:hypothetical protein GGI15_001474 [Coemansia interrupta]